MNLTLAVYQRSDASGRLWWTTLGLGPHTRAREGRASVKLQQALVEDLRKLLEGLPPRERAGFQLPRGLRLEQVALELNFKPPRAAPRSILSLSFTLYDPFHYPFSKSIGK